MTDIQEKQKSANKIISNLHSVLVSYILCKQYYLAKIVIEFIIEIQNDSIKDTGIYATYIDKLTEVKFDLTNFYNYVRQFNVKIYD